MTVPSASGRRTARPYSGIAVADAGVLDAAGDARVARAAVGVAHGEQRLASARRRGRASGRCRSGRRRRARCASGSPSRRCRPARRAGRAALDREVRLVDAEAAHRAARRVVRVDGERLDVDVRHLVGAAGVAGGALEHLVADAGVGAGVADDARPDARRRRPSRVAADRVVEPHRVALRVEAQALARGVSVSSTGRPVTGASSAVWHWTRRPPWRRTRRRSATSVTRTCVLGQRRGTRRSGGGRPRRPGPASRRGAPPSSGSGQRRLGLEEGVLDELRAEASRVTTCAAPRARRRRRRAARARPRARCRPRAASARPRRAPRTGRSPARAPRTRPRRARPPRGRRARRLGGDGGEHVADVGGRLALGDELAPVPGDRALRPLAGHVGRGDDRDDARVRRGPRRVDRARPAPAGGRRSGARRGASRARSCRRRTACRRARARVPW